VSRWFRYAVVRGHSSAVDGLKPISTAADEVPVSANQYVLVAGIRDTRATFERWSRDPWPMLRGWSLLSLAIASALIVAVWAVGSVATPDLTPIYLPGLAGEAGAANVVGVMFRNSLVLALHATACIAGFMAGASMPIAAAQRSGFSRWVHLKAGQLAIVFVTVVTIFSLSTQAYVLGSQGATIAFQLGISPGALVLTVLPHALPELVALFLPLAAWLIASRRGEWNQLLAATFATTAIALPVLLVCAVVEVYVWSDLLRIASPLV
jgi:hypothetical protein